MWPQPEHIIKRIPGTNGKPDVLFARGPEFIGGSAYFLRVSVDGGVTWTALGGTSWTPFSDSLSLFAGDDVNEEYMAITAGLANDNDRLFFYDGASWSSRVTMTGTVNTYAQCYDLCAGLNNAFYLWEFDSGGAGDYNIHTSTDGGATWTEFVANFNTGGQIYAMGIVPSIGLLIAANDGLWLSADGTTAPSLIAGSAWPAGYEPLRIIPGADRFSVWGINTAIPASRSWSYDGTDLLRGSILAYYQIASAPSNAFAAGNMPEFKGGWDGEKFLMNIENWFAGSVEASTMWISSKDGATWGKATVADVPLVYSVGNREFGVVAQ